MSNNKDFSRKKELMADNQSIYRWNDFQKSRPVTAHILSKLFEDEAYIYLPHISPKFTEQVAIDMIPYVHQRTNSNKGQNLVKRRVVKTSECDISLDEIS